MFAYLSGRLDSVDDKCAVLDVNGAGYKIFVDSKTSGRLHNTDNENVKIYVHTYVKEDAFELYGFLSIAEKDLFEVLIGVSGIGPRMALKVLSSVSVDDFKRALGNEDLSVLTNISGIGKKTAQRLILELKEKVGANYFQEYKGIEIPSDEGSVQSDAVAALLNLGYTRDESLRALRGAKQYLKEQNEEPNITNLIEMSLKQMG